MNKKLLVSFVLASLTGISTQAKEKMSSETTQQRPNIILFMVDDMDGKTLHYLSGHRKHIIMKPTKLPIWNVWPKKA